MKYRKLGTTDLDVSLICMGTMNFGEQNTESEGHEQMDYALSQGINFIDTAELYPIPPRGESHGRTEIYIGNWLKKRKNRDSLTIASKVIGPSDFTYVRGDDKPTLLDGESIRKAVDGSLKRLQIDTI